MLDMTTNKQEKETFIVNLMLSLKQNKFIVQYANGNKEEHPFTIEEYNKYLILLEQQFFKFKKDYIEKNRKTKVKILYSQLIETVVAITGVAISMNIGLSTEIESLLVTLIAIFSIYYQGLQNNKFDECNFEIYTTNLVEEFIKRKEEFKINLKDEETNDTTAWYAINLGNIWQISSVRELNEYNKDEKKDKVLKKLNKALNKNYVQI